MQTYPKQLNALSGPEVRRRRERRVPTRALANSTLPPLTFFKWSYKPIA